MKIYLASVATWAGSYIELLEERKPFVLESFYYVNSDTKKMLPFFGDFMLDSGAFTFMQNNKTRLDWEEYIEKYADFINQNKIKKFFELDIDSVVGYEQVKKYRAKLEKLTNRQCIPVWHKSRGIDEYRKMCDEYKYIAIGGIVNREIKPNQYKAFPAMIKEAHKKKCKVHGLGFTKLNLFPNMHFDSVDSTTWLAGMRFGAVFNFNGRKMKRYDPPKGYKTPDSSKVMLINFIEWVKFQKYAERCL